MIPLLCFLVFVCKKLFQKFFSRKKYCTHKQEDQSIENGIPFRLLNESIDSDIFNRICSKTFCKVKLQNCQIELCLLSQ